MGSWLAACRLSASILCMVAMTHGENGAAWTPRSRVRKPSRGLTIASRPSSSKAAQHLSVAAWYQAAQEVRCGMQGCANHLTTHHKLLDGATLDSIACIASLVKRNILCERLLWAPLIYRERPLARPACNDSARVLRHRPAFAGVLGPWPRRVTRPPLRGPSRVSTRALGGTSVVTGYRRRCLRGTTCTCVIAMMAKSDPCNGVKLPIRGGVNENVQNLHTVVTHEGERVPRKTHRQSIGRRAPVPNPMSFLRHPLYTSRTIEV